MTTFIIILIAFILTSAFVYAFLYRRPKCGCSRIVFYKKLQAIKKGQHPNFTGYGLTKKQIIKIRKHLKNDEVSNRYYQNCIKCRCEDDMSGLP